MKRSQMYKRGNRRKNSIFNHIDRNVVYPTLFFNPVVFNEEDIRSGVEIIEINSDDEPVQRKNKQSAWCTKYGLQDNYTINEENERIANNHSKGYKNNDYTYNDYAFDKACTDFYGIDCSGDRTYSKRIHSNVNKQVSDTSSSDIDVTQSETSLSDSYNSHKAYGKKTEITTNPFFEINRTYALNKANVSNEESTDSSSSEEELVKDFNTIRRVATPAPNYIPRLILPSSPTLPTVTEVTEPNKSTTMNENKSEKPFQKSNGWFDNDNLEIEREPNDKKEQRLSTFSERERRREKLKEIQETLESDQKILKYPQNKLKEIIQNLVNPKINKNDKDSTSVGECTDTKPEQKATNDIYPELRFNSEDRFRYDENTDSIEKLEGNWVISEHKTKNDKTLETFDCNLDGSRTNVLDDTKEKLSEKVTPSEGKCLTVSGNIPSLHLSFVSDEDRKSWFLRLLPCIQCCK